MFIQNEKFQHLKWIMFKVPFLLFVFFFFPPMRAMPVRCDNCADIFAVSSHLLQMLLLLSKYLASYFGRRYAQCTLHSANDWKKKQNENAKGSYSIRAPKLETIAIVRGTKMVKHKYTLKAIKCELRSELKRTRSKWKNKCGKLGVFFLSID